ncbi:MAG TPA: hypothetical protein VF146_16230 [Bryobacteraceae bacterium]
MNFLFTEAARADLRPIDRKQAMNILRALTRFAQTGEGDLKQLKGSKDLTAESGRLSRSDARIGRRDPHRAKHRKEAYRD